MAGPNQEILVLDEDALFRLWLFDKLQAGEITEAKADAMWREHQEKVKFAANYKSTGDDIVLLTKLAKDMRTTVGRVYFKRYGGKAHIILKGNARLRTILTGTRYGVRNAKIVSMGLGRVGVVKSAAGGTVITMVFMTAYNIVDYFIRDEATLGQLIGSIAVDLVKAAVAGAVGAAVGAAAVGVFFVGTFAVGPLVVGVVAGIAAGYLLDKLDERYQITKRVQALVAKGLARLEAIVEESRQSLLRGAANAAGALFDEVVDFAVDTAMGEIRRRLAPIRWQPFRLFQ